MTVLVGDIGATRARLGLARRDGGRPRVRERREYASAEFAGPGAVVRRYLEAISERPERGVIAVAAPIVGNRARFANLDWEVERAGLSRSVGTDDVHLLNDLEAVGHALPLLGEDDLAEVVPGEPEPGGAAAVLGAGSGLGHAFVTRRAGEEQVHSSEAAHVDFGPRTPTQEALLRWLREEYGRGSYERVVSGPGVVDAYRFLVTTGRAEERPGTLARFETQDPAVVVSRRGLEGSDPACRRALELFGEVYGAQAGNFALVVQATGGVFLGGGITPKVLPVLRGDGFREAFVDKGKMSWLVERTPVHAITETDAGLLGAARLALR